MKKYYKLHDHIAYSPNYTHRQDVTYISTGCIIQFLSLCGCTKKILLLFGPCRSTGREFLLK